MENYRFWPKLWHFSAQNWSETIYIYNWECHCPSAHTLPPPAGAHLWWGKGPDGGPDGGHDGGHHFLKNEKKWKIEKKWKFFKKT